MYNSITVCSFVFKFKITNVAQVDGRKLKIYDVYVCVCVFPLLIYLPFYCRINENEYLVYRYKYNKRLPHNITCNFRVWFRVRCVRDNIMIHIIFFFITMII